LQNFGLSALQAHLFIFWFALLSTITPPVCGTVFIAAGMADAPWLSVASKAMKLGIGLYIVPLAFIVNKALLYPQENLLLALFAFVKIALGLYLISNALVNNGLKTVIRVLLLLLALVIIFTPLSYMSY